MLRHCFSVFFTCFAAGVISTAIAGERPSVLPPDGAVVKAALNTTTSGRNLLRAERFGAYERGFRRQGKIFVCENGSEGARRGVSQSVELNQFRPEPIIATAWSKAEGVSGSPDPDYSVFLDLVYNDGTPLYGQAASFATGTHDWQERKVVILPEKPVKHLTFYMLFRQHRGTACFRDPELRVVKTPQGASVFDGIPVVPRDSSVEGFQVRDVAAGSDFVRIEREALGLKLDYRRESVHGAEILDVTLSDVSGKDRAVTLVYAVPAPLSIDDRSAQPIDTTVLAIRVSRWLDGSRTSTKLESNREYMDAGHFHAGANGRLARYPLAAVADDRSGVALGIDMTYPAFFRIGYNAGTAELFLAYDLGLCPEKPVAHLRFCRYGFDATWGFRGALARYYEIFPEAFRCRTPEQGLWMPFAAISKVKGWEDFGFKFKEGNDETEWDDRHGILTFHYTEPMTWWMPMAKSGPRTHETAIAAARQLAGKGNAEAKALFTSGYQNEAGEIPAQLLDTPWCNGAVWSMNSMPGIPGEVTDFKNKWNPRISDQLYGPKRHGDLDGEYIDSCEGYVTDELDFRRSHFSAARSPLVFSPDTHRPAIFRGLVAWEYARAIAGDIHGMGKLMMANGVPTQLCWLVPLVDVAGTETDWNSGGTWRPMSDADLLYRRALCKGKPYCFLMNTQFERFPHAVVEKYMKRCLAYGMFPGFFSHNASEGHYFSRPELYDRDRPLFQQYVPLCKRVAEAGWEPIPGARSEDPRVYVERFGAGSSWYLTVFNDSPDRRTTTITLDRAPSDSSGSSRELVRGGRVTWEHGKTPLALDPEDVAVLEIK
jgi:hypothetical protein